MKLALSVLALLLAVVVAVAVLASVLSFLWKLFTLALTAGGIFLLVRWWRTRKKRP